MEEVPSIALEVHLTTGNYDMKVNVKKTKAMMIGRNNDKVLNIKVNENQLEQVN